MNDKCRFLTTFIYILGVMPFSACHREERVAQSVLSSQAVYPFCRLRIVFIELPIARIRILSRRVWAERIVEHIKASACQDDKQYSHDYNDNPSNPTNSLHSLCNVVQYYRSNRKYSWSIQYFFRSNSSSRHRHVTGLTFLLSALVTSTALAGHEHGARRARARSGRAFRP